MLDQKLCIALAEEAGLVFNTDCIPNQKAYPWHRKALYNFAELVIKHQNELTKENAPVAA